MYEAFDPESSPHCTYDVHVVHGMQSVAPNDHVGFGQNPPVLWGIGNTKQNNNAAMAYPAVQPPPLALWPQGSAALDAAPLIFLLWGP